MKAVLLKLLNWGDKVGALHASEFDFNLQLKVLGLHVIWKTLTCDSGKLFPVRMDDTELKPPIAYNLV